MENRGAVSGGNALDLKAISRAALVFASATLMELPPRVLTLATFVASWPGMILALVAVPAAVTLLRRERS